MTRSDFLRTLAALLAGTHAAGPVAPGGLPDLLRRCVALPRTTPAVAARSTAVPPRAVACR